LISIGKRAGDIPEHCFVKTMTELLALDWVEPAWFFLQQKRDNSKAVIANAFLQFVRGAWGLSVMAI